MSRGVNKVILIELYQTGKSIPQISKPDVNPVKITPKAGFSGNG